MKDCLYACLFISKIRSHSSCSYILGEIWNVFKFRQETMPTTCLLTAREKFLDSHLTSFSLLLEGIKKVSYCMRSRMKVKEEFKKLVDIGIFGGGKEKTCLLDTLRS